MPSSDALILFAHGARDSRWSDSLNTLAAAIRAQAPEVSVSTAFLELQTPTLREALDAAASGGAERIHVVPVFWAAAGHVENELPPMLAQFTGRYPNVSVKALPVLSELPGLLEFIARAVARTLTAAPVPPTGQGRRKS
jgi:sirohydrochlorin cobaltochelatase